MSNLFKLTVVALIASSQPLFALAVAAVPDAGSTAPLLGLALGGLIMARNTLRRK